MRPLIYTGLGLFALLAWGMNQAGQVGANVPMKFQPVASYSPPPAPKPVLTMAHYEAVTVGMSYFDLLIALPVSGQEVSRAGSITTYIFRDGSRYMIVTLQSGSVAAKLQSGL